METAEDGGLAVSWEEHLVCRGAEGEVVAVVVFGVAGEDGGVGGAVGGVGPAAEGAGVYVLFSFISFVQGFRRKG